MQVNVANSEDWVQAARGQNITITFPVSTAVPAEQPFIRDNLLDLPWSEEIVNLPKIQIDSMGVVEMIKTRIKGHIDGTDELPDQKMIAEELQVETELVDQAYEELVEEGIVHRETFHLFKNPATRKRLLEAMETKEEISLEEVHERLGVEERPGVETASP
ncbi:GntR family transcriptional regulator [Candidatus Poribacteria bacterium]|nr:GntR family transcriptional regulator [Candidatus Poribacteria bacterium]